MTQTATTPEQETEARHMTRWHFNLFTTAYEETLLWSESDEEGENFEDREDDLSSEAVCNIVTDCAGFLAEAYERIIQAADSMRNGTEEAVIKQAGHDFCLTRNGHGAGFWDGDWPQPHAQALTEMAKAYSTQGLFEDEDGTLYTHG